MTPPSSSPRSSQPPNPLLDQFLSEARDLLEGIAAKLLELESSSTGSDAGSDSNPDRIHELFRLVHTLKGNSGLFTFPEMTRVLHAAEDLMGLIRSGQLAYSQALADPLLDAMDFVGLLCDDIEASAAIDPARAPEALRLAAELRALMQDQAQAPAGAQAGAQPAPAGGARDGSPALALLPDAPESRSHNRPTAAAALLSQVPEERRMAAFRRLGPEDSLQWIVYQPVGDAFFQGDDPLHTARRTPELVWGRILPDVQFPPLAEFDTYRSLLQFELLSAAPHAELAEYFRYIPDQVSMRAVPLSALILPQGGEESPESASPEKLKFLSGFASISLELLEDGDTASLREQAESMLGRAEPASRIASVLRWLVLVLECQPENHAAARQLLVELEGMAPEPLDSQPYDSQPFDSDFAAQTGRSSSRHAISNGPYAPHAADPNAAVLDELYRAQAEILALPDRPAWHPGRLTAAAAALANLARAEGDEAAAAEVRARLAEALQGDSAPLLQWARSRFEQRQPRASRVAAPSAPASASVAFAGDSGPAAEAAALHFGRRAEDNAPKFGRRADDALQAPKTLKVDQAKIDRLMNLIGELIVA